MPEDGNGKPSQDRRCFKDFESFRKLVESAKASEKRVALFTHSYPDPDAIGSMMGMAWLLYKVFGLESDSFYNGEISHPQNNSLCNLLGPDLKRVNQEYVPEDYALRILVDTIPANAGVGDHKVDFDVVIDHHKEVPNGGYTGLVIHMKTGACCSVIFHMMQYFCKDVCWFEDDNDHDSKTATAMIAGVVTDTEYMVSDDTTEFEFETFTKLYSFRNSNFLKQIVFFKRPKAWIDAKASASVEADVDDEGFAIVGLGLIPAKGRDVIADMSEEMVTWASVETAIAFAVVGGDRIEGSIRSLNPSISVSDLCKKLGGKFGSGGGKMGKGAYRYDLGGMSIAPDEDEDIKNKTWKLIKERETKRIIREIKK
jgi:nanoRNase/pAp phosphatase (c-di-AMP/oligoRNAs hydrolase)